MIGSVSASRRAHAFAEALDERDHELSDEFGDDAVGDNSGPEEALLLEVTRGLSALPKPQLDPEVKTVQRAQLIAAMETAFAEGAVGAGADQVPERTKEASRASGLGGLGRLRPKSRLGRGLAAGGLSVGVAATASGGVAAASSQALPGDTLYGLKRGIEDFRMDFADGDTDRGQLYLHHASTRLREAHRLLETDRTDSLDHEALGEIRRALSSMRHDATEGHRLLSSVYARNGELGPMQSLSSFSRHHLTRWTDLRDRLPVQLTDVGEQVSSVFAAIEEEVGPLRPLFPPASGDDSDDSRPGAQDSDGDGGQPVPSRSHGAAGGTAEDGGQPKPSGSEDEGGLLGDSELPDLSHRSGDDPEGSGKPEASPANPDITLPPLIPDVIPGLRAESSGH